MLPRGIGCPSITVSSIEWSVGCHFVAIQFKMDTSAHSTCHQPLGILTLLQKV